MTMVTIDGDDDNTDDDDHHHHHLHVIINSNTTTTAAAATDHVDDVMLIGSSDRLEITVPVGWALNTNN